MHPARRGSVLLFCLAIVATLSVLAYGFVRVAQLNQESNSDSVKMMLAREAARMGVNHGIEQIMRDYISEPFTRMDGPARAGFVAHDTPYLTNQLNLVSSTYVWNAAQSRFIGADLDDVAGSRQLFPPLFNEWLTGGYVGAGDTFNWAWNGWYLQAQGGMVNNDGRARYLEPNWSNRLAGPVAAAPAHIRFGQDMSSDPTPPERSDAIFYDENWRRVAGDPRVARNNARYRLRYAVNVTDLDGEILINPDPEINYRQFTSADPRTYPAATARIVRAQHAIVPMIQAMGYHGSGTSNGNFGVTGGVKAEHVFIGRGYTTNFDQAIGNDTPVFFPLMFRRSTTTTNNFFRYYLNDQDATGVPASPPWQDPAPRLFTMGGVAADPAGGQPIPLPVADPYGFPLRRCLLGPQYSFYNFDTALYSNNFQEDWNGWARDGQLKSVGCLTPFGRGLSLDAGAPTRYSGPSDTPWAVNVLTAPVQVVSAMIYGYMPPGAITTFSGGAVGFTPTWLEARSSRDLFVSEISPVFPYSAPTFQTVTPNYHVEHVRPGDAGYRLHKNRYPGVMGPNGYDSASTMTHDTLGYYLRATAGGVPGTPKPVARIDGNDHDATLSGDGADLGGFDPYAAIPFMKAVYNWSEPPTPSRNYRHGAPTGLTNRSYTINHPDSIWRVIAQAMGTAVAVARAQVMSMPTAAADPATMFDGGAWSDSRVQSIADIDKLFLANLGVNIADPTNISPPSAAGQQSLRAWYGKLETTATASGVKVYFTSFAPGWNVATLSTLPAFDEAAPTPVADHPNAPYLAIERTALIEMIINDFRVSFFGSNPAYANFQALDLNGDGMVTCSALGANATATARQAALGIDHFAAISPGASIPSGNIFSHTGCFTVTKSHFWRIMTRGEVWDNFYKTVVGQAALDTVVCIDPMDTAKELGAPASRDPALGQYSTHVMYQKWVFDFNRASMSRKQ